MLSGSFFFKKTGIIQEKGVLGGPAPSLVASAEGAELGQVALAAMGDQAIVNPPAPLPAESADNVQNGVLESVESVMSPSSLMIQAAANQSAQIEGFISDSSITTTTAKLPNFNRYFIMPANGYNWGILHNYNAVDIANSCGTPVVASADGLVVPDENIPDAPGGWNEGYGNFVLLQHSFGNNVMTRYAHLESISVQIGDYVKQGQVIGLMGETGDATGCHVHFEVIGAQNPFAKN